MTVRVTYKDDCQHEPLGDFIKEETFQNVDNVGIADNRLTLRVLKTPTWGEWVGKWMDDIEKIIVE